MVTHDSIQSSIERCLNILSPNINTFENSMTLQEHVIEIASCVKDLNNLVLDLDDRIKVLEELND